VGIYLDKSSAAIVSIFGILKAGAAYVPLDSKSPVARVGLMADDCRLAALVSDGHKLATLLPSLQFPPSCLVLSNDGSADLPEIPHTELIGWQDVLHAPAAALSDNGAIETDLAYILYTSGSTGRPKGVMISHRAALTFVNWAADYFQLKPDDRLSNHAPLHFDLSIFDLFAGLAASATVVLVPAETAIFPYSLAAWMAENRISVWYSVPSALIQLVLHGELESHDLSALRLVLFAGEVFPVQHLRRLQQMVPAPAYYNLYGPTETNVCTVYPVPTLSAEQSTPCPIGRACANMQVFALDEQGQEIGPDQIGELYVRGPDLMRGYWNLPDVTATVLLPNPLNPTGGEQVYRTGDLVRLDRDGNLVFVGRRDGMVKSRGYRIEVGEIEAVLYRHPGVAEAAVIPVVDEEIGHRLVGFVAPSPGSTVHSDELLAHCQAHLPAYMTPERIEVRSALPKTSTGKIDRLQLRSSETGQRRE
jgi:amino acid adenylation domain-containing protein